MRCSVDIRTEKWPYVQRCANPATSTLSDLVYEWADHQFDLSLNGKEVCAEHGHLIIEAYKSEQ